MEDAGHAYDAQEDSIPQDLDKGLAGGQAAEQAKSGSAAEDSLRSGPGSRGGPAAVGRDSVREEVRQLGPEEIDSCTPPAGPQSRWPTG